MKIEPFPWLRDYYLDMNKLYTELILEKIENEVLGVKRLTLRSYKEMFERVQLNRPERDKILLKADPEMGKTTLGKKIGFDWAKGLFQKYSIVFFVHLKFVKPDDSIESAIFQQHTELRGLKLSERKLREMLERFGDRCLLILDGLDEHGLGKNRDVLKIIINETLLDCGIVVSSRPHSINEVQIHFPTIVRVEGFTEDEASKFISNFFTNRNIISEILKFKPSDSREDFPVHKCPILLSILCLLVKEKQINLSKEKLTIGDMYFQMVQCLYRKYTIRKGTGFVESEFVNVMKSVGILGLKTLLSNKPLLQKSEVLEIAGKFAFEYGFFAGHDDFRLCTDPTADISVTYAHRSLEEFFGSFGFTQALNDGKSVDYILGSDCENPIFIVNPLVLNFCLWFLSKEYLESSNQIYDTLTSYVAKRIECYTLHTEFVGKIFPAINIGNSRPDNALVLKFFKDVSKKCVDIRILHVLRTFTADESFARNQVNTILGRLSPNILDKLTVLTITAHVRHDVNIDLRSNFNIVISNHDMHASLEILKVLLTNYNLLKRNPHVYLTISGISNLILCEGDLTLLMSKQIKELRLDGGLPPCSLVASGKFPSCPHFTHFIAKGHIDDSVPSAFVKAVKEGKFPSLRRIELYNCTMNDFEWPEVQEFCLKPNTTFDTSRMQKLVLNLTELTLDGLHDHRISTHLTKLSVLKIKKASEHNLSQLNDVLRQGKLPNLTELSINDSADEHKTKLDRFLDNFDLDRQEN